MNRDQKLFDEILSNALDILRLSAAKRAKVVARLQALSKELVAQIATGGSNLGDRESIARFLAASETIIRNYYQTFEAELSIPGISEAVIKQTATALEVVLGAEAIKLPIANYAASVASDVLIQGAPSAEWWLAQERDLTLKFANQVRLGLTAAETNEQIVSRIVGKFGQPGIMEIAKNNARSLVSTSVQTVANDARRKTYLANGDLVKGIQQVSTLDSHTSDICIAYAGAKWDLKFQPIGDAPPYNGGTPRHWLCRSVEVPLTLTFRELGINIDEMPTGTRASDEGQIALDTSFDTFLKRKGKVYQDGMLGEGRADLWRAGKITLRDLVNGEGRPMTLAELRRKAGLD